MSGVRNGRRSFVENTQCIRQELNERMRPVCFPKIAQPFPVKECRAFENSRAIYGWEKRPFGFPSPGGTTEILSSLRDLTGLLTVIPELKLWAIFTRKECAR